MKASYIAPECEIFRIAQEKGILSLSDGSGSGSDMDPGDYSQNPF